MADMKPNEGVREQIKKLIASGHLPPHKNPIKLKDVVEFLQDQIDQQNEKKTQSEENSQTTSHSNNKKR